MRRQRYLVELTRADDEDGTELGDAVFDALCNLGGRPRRLVVTTVPDDARSVEIRQVGR